MPTKKRKTLAQRRQQTAKATAARAAKREANRFEGDRALSLSAVEFEALTLEEKIQALAFSGAGSDDIATHLGLAHEELLSDPILSRALALGQAENNLSIARSLYVQGLIERNPSILKLLGEVHLMERAAQDTGWAKSIREKMRHVLQKVKA